VSGVCLCGDCVSCVFMCVFVCLRVVSVCGFCVVCVCLV
jgi:hypothetical protein